MHILRGTLSLALCRKSNGPSLHASNEGSHEKLDTDSLGELTTLDLGLPNAPDEPIRRKASAKDSDRANRDSA
jgi:hypothetical protein